jgi:hypothetical protein
LVGGLTYGISAFDHFPIFHHTTRAAAPTQIF